MPAGQQPIVRRQRLGNELRRLREGAGVSMEEAAKRLGGDKPKMSRLETGKQGVTKAELEVLLSLYQVTDPGIVAALDAMRASRKKKNWWQQYGDILGPQLMERLSIEEDAVRILAYQPLLVPGLMQTPDYARAINRGVQKTATDAEVESFVKVRMARQSIFEREAPPQYVCILDEAVLHRQVGGAAVMRDQLNHLVNMSNPPELTIQVIPFSHGWHPGLDGPFSIYAYPDPLALDVVVLDYLEGALYLEEDVPVDKYRLAFDQLRASALSSRQSMELISRTARGLDIQ